MTAIKTPPGGVRATRGFFLWYRHTALRFIRFDFNSVSYLSLGLDTVAVAVNGFNKMHTAIANRRFFSILASLLVIPGRTCTATRHQPRHAEIGTAQPHFAGLLAQQAIAFLIRYAFRHFNQKPLPIRFFMNIIMENYF